MNSHSILDLSNDLVRHLQYNYLELEDILLLNMTAKFFNVFSDYELDTFRKARQGWIVCTMQGHLGACKYLYEKGKITTVITGFTNSLISTNIETVKWLYDLCKVDDKTLDIIKTSIPQQFESVCSTHDNKKVLQWLFDLYKDQFSTVEQYSFIVNLEKACTLGVISTIEWFIDFYRCKVLQEKDMTWDELYKYRQTQKGYNWFYTGNIWYRLCEGLIKAAKNGDLITVKYIFDNMTNEQKQSITLQRNNYLLRHVCQNNHYELAKYLLPYTYVAKPKHLKQTYYKLKNLNDPAYNDVIDLLARFD